MTTFEQKWREFILPYIHRAIEILREDPDTSYDEWKFILKNYEDTVGHKYERKQ